MRICPFFCRSSFFRIKKKQIKKERIWQRKKITRERLGGVGGWGGYLVAWPRDARQPERHFLGQSALHQPVTVAGHQQEGQQDGELRLWGGKPGENIFIQDLQ